MYAFVHGGEVNCVSRGIQPMQLYLDAADGNLHTTDAAVEHVDCIVHGSAPDDVLRRWLGKPSTSRPSVVASREQYLSKSRNGCGRFQVRLVLSPVYRTFWCVSRP